MADNKSTPVMVRFSPEQITSIDEWRRHQSDLPTRPEAVRRLTEFAIETAKAAQKEKT